MAIQIQGSGGTVADVDGTTFRALRITPRPIDYGSLGFYRVGLVSGTMAAGLAANAEIYQARWTDATRLAMYTRVAISAGMNVAATAAGLAAFRLAVVRGWSADGSGGTTVTLTGDNQKLRKSMGSSLMGAMRVSSTAALTAGTKTFDAQDHGAIATGIGTGAITTSVSLPIVGLSELLNIDSSSDHPILLVQNEGVVVRIGPAMPATMTWHFAASVSWAEVAVY